MDTDYSPFRTSCFTSHYPEEYNMRDSSPDDDEARGDLTRRLSFRENTDFLNHSFEDSPDLMTDFFNKQRRMTSESFELDEAKRASLILDSEPMETDYCLSLPSTKPSSQNSASNHSQHNFEQDNYTLYSPRQLFANERPTDEEYQDVPFIEEFQTEASLMDRVNGSKGNTPMKENINMLNRGFDIQNNYGYFGEGELPNPCLQSSQSDPTHMHQDSSMVFQSPGKRFNNSSLATCRNFQTPDLRTITPETLVELMTNSSGKKYLIIDCRYEYEYEGGHIKGAINITNPEYLEEVLIRNRSLLCKEETLEMVKQDCKAVISHTKVNNGLKAEVKATKSQDLSPPILIFHCEFSQKRGPRALRALRNLDRTLNHINWPNLYYPEVYILDRGYKNFHSKFPYLCDPENQYIRMLDKEYKSHYAEAKVIDRKLWNTQETQESEEPSTKFLTIQRTKTMNYA